MKVLHLSKYYPPYFGGLEQVVFDLVEQSNAQGVQTDVLCSLSKGEESKNFAYQVFREKSLLELARTPLSLNLVLKLRKICKNYDVLHVHAPNPMAYLAVLLSGFKGKLVLHWHSDVIKQKNLLKLILPLQNWILRRAQAIIVTSPNYLADSEQLKGFENKCHVVPIGVSNGHLQGDPSVVERLNQDYPQKRKVFALGRLIYYKGFEYLIDAAEYLDDQTMILIGGIGPLRESLEERIASKKLSHKVKLVGKIPSAEIGSYYEWADLYCMSSIEKSEAYGVVQVEAMAKAKAVLSTNIVGSGVPWVNQHNYSGKVVPPKNAKALADAMIELCDSPEQLKQFGEQALLRYQELFTPEVMARKSIEIYMKRK